MRNKLFTASVDKMLFKQYSMGSDLDKQKVVTKIFNPYGEGRWYLLNSDPNDPDYIWAIVSMFGNVEIGSVSRSELESIRLRPFGLPLERDLYFTPKNAKEVYEGLLSGKFFEEGGETNQLYTLYLYYGGGQNDRVIKNITIEQARKLALTAEHFELVDNSGNLIEIEFAKGGEVGGGNLRVEKKADGKYYWSFTFNNGRVEKSFSGFETSADAQKDFHYRSRYFGKGGGTNRPLYVIANEIRGDWKNVYFGAKPYLSAMSTLNDISDYYFMDSARDIVNYFLANATTWRGDNAKRIKAELKSMVKYNRGGKITIRDIEWSNDDNKQLGLWLLTSVDGNKIVRNSKNAHDLEKNVMEYYAKKGSIAKMKWDDNSDEGLAWVTFVDLYNEINSLS
jgi:hypothetical protein